LGLFKKGLDLDKDSVPSLQGFARTTISAVDNGWAPRDQRTLWLDRAEAAIARVIALRPRSYGAYRLRGSLLRARQEPDQAIKAFEKALELNDSYGSAYAELGRTKIELGRADEGSVDIRKAIALNPTDPALHGWLVWAGQAAIHVGDFASALDWFRKAQAQETDHSGETTTLWLAIALGELGETTKARSVVANFLKNNAEFSIAQWREDHPRQNPVVAAQRARIESMLCRLGVPGCPLATGFRNEQ
jgi:tetratricopeptide (TPR) repeat protein